MRTFGHLAVVTGFVLWAATATSLSPGLAGDVFEQLAPGHWYEVPNSELRAVLPAPRPAGNPSAIMEAWSGGTYDPVREALVLPANGGHADYGGNEVYAFFISSLSWERLTEPSVAPLPDQGIEASTDEIDDVSGANPVDAREDAADRGRHGMPGERAELERVLAVRGPGKAADRRVRPVGRNVVPPFQRRKRHRRGPSVGMPGELHHRVHRRRLVGERVDGGEEGRLELERLRDHPAPVVVRLERLGACVRGLDAVESLVLDAREKVLEVEAVRLAGSARLHPFPEHPAQGHETHERQCADDQVDDVHARVPSRAAPATSRERVAGVDRQGTSMRTSFRTVSAVKPTTTIAAATSATPAESGLSIVARRAPSSPWITARVYRRMLRKRTPSR